jgi:hypothetical protein
MMPMVETRTREFGNLQQIPDNYPKYVVSLDPLPQGDEQGVKWLYLTNFLRDFQ